MSGRQDSIGEVFLFDPTREGRDYSIFWDTSEQGGGFNFLTLNDGSHITYEVLGTRTVKGRSFYVTTQLSPESSSMSLDKKVVLAEASSIRQLTTQEIREIIGGSGEEGSVDAACYALDAEDYFQDNVVGLGTGQGPFRVVGSRWFASTYSAGVSGKSSKS